jgi:hypothetical protein
MAEETIKDVCILVIKTELQTMVDRAREVERVRLLLLNLINNPNPIMEPSND